LNQANADLDRRRSEYDARRLGQVQIDYYSLFNPGHLFIVQSRRRAELKLLRRHGFDAWRDRRVLELGCGPGAILLEYLSYGIPAMALHGLDLLPRSLQDARLRLSHLPLTCGDGRRLPYASGTFDLIMQYTAFSSVLDNSIRASMAREMLRLLRDPDGMILWYDFWINPTNLQTRGIRQAEIRHLFPDCDFAFQRITLAPPLARRLAPVSWMLCHLLEKLRIFNTHYLVAIRKRVARAGI
jgi:SAM-dependent methyltransferase